MTGFADAFAPPSVRLTCPGTWRNADGEPRVCGRFVAELVGTYLEPPPCRSCGTSFVVRVAGGVPHYEITRRGRTLTPIERGTDNPPEHT